MRKFIPLVFVALAAIGCSNSGSTAVDASAGGGGGTASPDKTYTLKFSPKEGDKADYELKMDAAQVKLSMGMTMKCTKAEDDKYTMLSTYDKVDMEMNGKKAPQSFTDMLTNMKVTSVMDSHGKTLSSSVEGGQGNSGAPNVGSASFPTEPVKIGDTWDGTMKMNGADISSKYKLTKVEGDTATIEVTMDKLPSGLTQDGPSITQVDLTTGLPVSVVSKLKGKDQTGKEQSMVIELKRK